MTAYGVISENISSGNKRKAYGNSSGEISSSMAYQRENINAPYLAPRENSNGEKQQYNGGSEKNNQRSASACIWRTMATRMW